MRRKYINSFMVSFALTSIIAFIILVSLFIFGPNPRLSEYYADDTNYMELTFQVDNFEVYNDESLYLTLSDGTDYFGDGFVIRGKNFQIIKSQGLLEDIKVFSRIEIIFAPGYFSDAWSYPIVSVKIEDKTYLHYDEGKDNLVSKYEKYKKSFQIFSTIAIPVISISSFLSIFYLVKFLNSKQKENE